MTGGQKEGFFSAVLGPERSAIRFDLATNTFKNAPDLQKARCGHSSFALNGRIYVFAGFDAPTYLKSIERLNVTGNASQWELIELSQLSAWSDHMASALNDNQFLIAGGYGA